MTRVYLWGEAESRSASVSFLRRLELAGTGIFLQIQAIIPIHTPYYKEVIPFPVEISEWLILAVDCRILWVWHAFGDSARAEL